LPEVYQSAPKNQWKGKKVAYLGDSITDKIHVGTTKNYWQYLQEMLGIEPLVYGINGHQWNGILEQAKKLKAEQGDKIDAIFIFAGTNDYNGSVPLGEWYTTKEEETRVSGPSTAVRKRRITVMDNKTVRGRINMAMDYLKTNFPTQQIIVLTPIHRAFAQFGEKNIQPDESFPNALGLYIDDYVSAIKETANVWAVPVIDLNSICGLYPLKDEYVRYFHDGKTDRLHPNAEGHYRMAKALMYQLLAYPSDFK
jgi:lysophospholipase L1-like esterase